MTKKIGSATSSSSSSSIDNTKLWSNYPIQDDPWVGTHNALRKEIIALEKAMKVLSNQPMTHDEIDHLQAALSTHLNHCSSHHITEEQLLKPKLVQKIQKSQLPSKSFLGHDDINMEISKLKPLVEKLQEGDTCNGVLQQLQHYENVLLPHMKEEEETMIPLLRKHFTPSEMSPISRQFFTNGPKEMTGSYIDQMGEVAFRNEYMKREGIPFFVWYMGFKPGLTAFMSKFRNHIDALNANANENKKNKKNKSSVNKNEF